MSKKNKLRVIFAGSADVSIPALKELLDSDFCRVCAILTNPDAPKGRSGRLTPNALKDYALLVNDEADIEIPILENLDDLHIYVNNLSDVQKPELGIAVAYGKLLKTADLELLSKGWINLHFSILPAYRGASPVQTAILDGCKSTGVSVFQISEGLDDGDIIISEPFDIPDNATSDELFTMISPFGAVVLKNAVKRLVDGTATFTKQPDNESIISHTKKLLKSNSRIDWNTPDADIVHKINAYSSNPGAWFELVAEDKPPLRVVAIKAKLDNNGKVELLQVKPAGKNVMNYTDWVRGLRGNWQIT